MGKQYLRFTRKACPDCPEGNKNSPMRGVFQVFETNKKLILKCKRCGHRITYKKHELKKPKKDDRKKK